MSINFNLLQSTVPEDPKRPDVQEASFPVVEDHQASNNVDPAELQRCMETDLALFASSAGVGGLISNYHFRQLISSLCSGLRLPPIDVEIDNCLTTNYHEVTDIMKHVLRDIQKLVVMVNLVYAEKSKVDVLCVSVAFEFQKRLEVVLLAVWEYDFDQYLRCFEIQPVITDTFELYGLKSKQISHTLVGGFEERGINPSRILVTNYFVSNYQSQLLSILDSVLNRSNVYRHFRSRCADMIESFCNNEDACDAFYKTTGYFLYNVLFEKQLWILLMNRDNFLSACAQNVAHGQIFTIYSDEWSMLEDFFYLRRAIYDHTSAVKDANYLTIDHIVPQINSLCFLLNENFKSLDMLPLRIAAKIQEKFAHLLDPEKYSHDAVFIAATALNPRLHMCLDEKQRTKALFELEEMLYQRVYTTNRATAKFAIAEDHVYSNKPGSGRVDKRCNDYIETFLTNAVNQKCMDDKFNENKKIIKRLVVGYFEDVQKSPNNPLFENPLNFWHTNAEKYSDLATLALDLLSIPASATMPQELVPLDEDLKNVAGNTFSTNDPFDFIRFSSNIDDLERNAVVFLNRNFYYAAKHFMPLENGVKKGASMATAKEIQMVYESEHFQQPNKANDDAMEVEMQPAPFPFLPPPTILNNLPLANGHQKISPIPPPGLVPPPFFRMPFMPPGHFPPSYVPRSGFFGSPHNLGHRPFNENFVNTGYRPKRAKIFKGPLLLVHGLNLEDFNCERLYNLFSLYGRVIRIKFSMQYRIGTCFVEMETSEQAKNAHDFLNYVDMFGTRLLIHPSYTHDEITTGGIFLQMKKGGLSFVDYSSKPSITPEESSVKPSSKVMFYNIPSSFTKEEVCKYFAEREPTGPMPIELTHFDRSDLLNGIMTFDSVISGVEAVAIYNNMNLADLEPAIKLCFVADS